MYTGVSIGLPGRATITIFFASLLIPFFLARPMLASGPSPGQNFKVVGGYFDEWILFRRLQHCQSTGQWRCQ
jgi:chitinase